MPYLDYRKISKNHCNRPLYSGQSRVEKIGKNKFLVSRDVFLDKMGNPVYRVASFDGVSTTGKSYRSTNEAMAFYDCYKDVNGIKDNSVKTKKGR